MTITTPEFAVQQALFFLKNREREGTLYGSDYLIIILEQWTPSDSCLSVLEDWCYQFMILRDEHSESWTNVEGFLLKNISAFVTAEYDKQWAAVEAYDAEHYYDGEPGYWEEIEAEERAFTREGSNYGER